MVTILTMFVSVRFHSAKFAGITGVTRLVTGADTTAALNIR